MAAPSSASVRDARRRASSGGPVPALGTAVRLSCGSRCSLCSQIGEQQVDQVRASLVQVGPHRCAGGARGWAWLTGLTGATMLQLHRTDKASDLPTESVIARATGNAKGRAPATLDLASCRLIVGEAEEAVPLVEHALSLARGGVVGPIVSRARSVRADMMAVDETSDARIARLLHEVASRAERQE